MHIPKDSIHMHIPKDSVHIHTYAHTHIHTYAHTHIRTPTCAHIHIYIAITAAKATYDTVTITIASRVLPIPFQTNAVDCV